MSKKDYSHLSDEEFESLANEQAIKYPDLLCFGAKEDIVRDFYVYYKRKRNGVMLKPRQSFNESSRNIKD